MRQLTMFIAACCIPGALFAQTPIQGSTPAEEVIDPFRTADAQDAVSELARKLEENFVFPEIGRAYAAMLRNNLASGKYAHFADTNAFADALSDDLQAVQRDGHLRVHVVPIEARSNLGEDAQGRPQGSGGPPPDYNAVTAAGWLSESVAYISFAGFPGSKATLAAVEKFIIGHAGAKTLIIDVREHSGGGIAEMDLMFPHMFKNDTVLVGMDTRSSVDARNTESQPPSIRPSRGPEGVARYQHHAMPLADTDAFRETNILVLTSKRTASAGEHFALALKRTGRATLIGETTMGLGHYGSMELLDTGRTYVAIIPFGRSFDPDTGEGWEATGISPHISVSSDEALDVALAQAGLKVSGEVALASLY